MTMNDDIQFSNDAVDASASDVIVEEIIEEIDVIVDEAGDIEVIDTEIEVDVIDTDELLEQARPRAQSPFDRPGRWYVVHTQSGYEKKVKQNLEARTQSMNMEDSIHECVIPMEDVVEFKNGKKQIVQKKVFPGYLLVRCDMTDDSWYVIRNTPGITGFVGQGAKPSPLPRRDVENFLTVPDESEEVTTKRGKPRLEYEQGETVRVKVLVNIFGRETPVELEFSQVAKL